MSGRTRSSSHEPVVRVVDCPEPGKRSRRGRRLVLVDNGPRWLGPFGTPTAGWGPGTQGDRPRAGGRGATHHDECRSAQSRPSTSTMLGIAAGECADDGACARITGIVKVPWPPPLTPPRIELTTIADFFALNFTPAGPVHLIFKTLKLPPGAGDTPPGRCSCTPASGYHQVAVLIFPERTPVNSPGTATTPDLVPLVLGRGHVPTRGTRPIGCLKVNVPPLVVHDRRHRGAGGGTRRSGAGRCHNHPNRHHDRRSDHDILRIICLSPQVVTS